MTRPTKAGTTRPLTSAGSLSGGGGELFGGAVESGLVPTSTGSNTWLWLENVRRITANGSNTILGPFVNVAAGSNIILTVDQFPASTPSNTLRIHSTGGGGGGSLTVEDEGTPLATDATTLNFVGAGVTASGTGATKTITIPGGGGSADDPVQDIFGTPDTAYEFDSALSGWTTLGSPTTLDANSTIPGHCFIYRTAASTANCGIYRAVGTFPQTYITKVSDHTVAAVDYQRPGFLFIAQASPGVIEMVHLLHSGDWIATHERWTNPTTYSTTPGSNITTKFVSFPLYLAVVVNSSTDVDFWYSFAGRTWRKRTDAYNPSITVGAFGIGINPENGSTAAAGAFDYVRVWNTALTFPGF